MFTTLDKSSEKSFYSVNSASVCLYWIQASVIVERGGKKRHVGSFVSSSIFVLPTVSRGDVCMHLGETQPTQEAKC